MKYIVICKLNDQAGALGLCRDDDSGRRAYVTDPLTMKKGDTVVFTDWAHALRHDYPSLADLFLKMTKCDTPVKGLSDFKIVEVEK